MKICPINSTLHNDYGYEWKLNTACEPQQIGVFCQAIRSFIILSWFIFHAAVLLVTRKVRIFPHTAAKDKVISSGKNETAVEITL